MGELSTLPVSLKVAGRRIVIVGGGDEALNKARIAVRTRAQVLVVAPHIEVSFEGLGVDLEARHFVEADLDGAAAVFVATEGGDAGIAITAARSRGVPLNVVDQPDLCDFYTPSFIEQAPLTIAISSEGDAPVLARLVRARIEAVLGPRVGALARLAGNMRERVFARLADGVARRRYFEALATSAHVDAALSRGQGERAAEDLLDQAAKASAEPGIVWLIGAGPGAEDLLTLRAQRLLQSADVIVHDQLVPQAVIDMGRRDAERISVGKKKGHHSFTQAQINALIVRLAGEGRRVARLKSGDPMVFGRAGEEITALRKAGIAFEIVPGVSAALAAAADSATSVTLRKVSPGFVIATAHGAEDEELAHWAALAGAGMTLALYMGKSIAAEAAGRLLTAGLVSSTPVGIAVNAGRPDRVLIGTTLSALATGAVELPDGPAVILVGEAVASGQWSDPAVLADVESRVA